MMGQHLVLGGSIDKGIVSAADGHAGQQLAGDVAWRSEVAGMFTHDGRKMGGSDQSQRT